MENIKIDKTLSLENSEIKKLPDKVCKLLDIIIKEYPYLKSISFETFKPKNNFDAGGYYEFDKDERGDPIPKIFISEGDSNAFTPLLEIRKYSIELNSESLGISPKEMTAELLQLFIVAHELGHINDYKKNFEADPKLKGWEAVEEMEYQREQTLSTLPVQNLTPTDLASELKNINTLQEAINIFPEIKNYNKFEKINNLEDLLKLQEKEYRQSPMEKYADDFATKFLKKYASKLEISDIIKK